MRQTISLAIAGNPNAGKTSVFNAITGAHQRVGNYPGVTVERKEGRCRYGDFDFQVADLPGTYSLTSYSAEETVARNHLIDEKPDAVVCVVDASNLERNLFLALQLKEMGAKLVIALNMIDVARSRGLEFDLAELSRRLDSPIVPTVGHKGDGVKALLDEVIKVASKEGEEHELQIDFGREISECIASVSKCLSEFPEDARNVRRNWVALKLIESDAQVSEQFGTRASIEEAGRCAAELERVFGEAPEVTVAQARYNVIASICGRTVRGPARRARTKSERIDAIVTHRVFGLPIFFALMYLVFQLTFTVGAPLMDLIDTGVGWIGAHVAGLWAPQSDSLLRSLIVDGVIGGVGAVIIFLPNILLLFLAIGLLESSGYMTRAAFIMDRLMQKMGLHGKSFIPMLIGFGCSIPAIMATRTLASRRDRLTTMMVIPLISCSARLPIYLLIIPAFFPSVWHAPMLFFIYVIGIALAVISARLLRATAFRGELSPFLMELPPYKVPTAKSSLIQMWERSRLFLRKAGTMILGVTVILWALTSFPKYRGDEVLTSEELAAVEIENSLAGRIGRSMEPLIRPMGFDWKIGTALIGAFAAKEVFVAQMGIVYSLGPVDESSSSLRDRLRKAYSPLVAFCIMLFTLISSPCVATVAVIRRESNSWGWAVGQFVGLTATAYILTVAVFQIGSRIGGVM